FERRSTIPSRSSARRRWVSSVRDIPGSPCESSLNRWAPSARSRTTRSVQRSPRTSAALATGQYWPYVRTPLSLPPAQSGRRYRFCTSLAAAPGTVSAEQRYPVRRDTHGHPDRDAVRGAAHRLRRRRAGARGGFRDARRAARRRRQLRRGELRRAQEGEALLRTGAHRARWRRRLLRGSLRDHPRDRARVRVHRARVLDALAPAPGARLAPPSQRDAAGGAAPAADRGRGARARLERRVRL